ncbi:MAG: PQQ-like beta-propeller repeat protein [Holosporaceae bacterium]|nr:PQQ-like beta-propeller repeat protein [Holosporaceae bacterium]
MKQVPVSIFLCLVLAACSSKDPIPGVREELAVAEVGEWIAADVDKTPVAVDEEKENADYPQAFHNATHCYPPVKFSLSPTEIWQSSVDFESSRSVRMMAAPVAADGRVFCIDAGGVVYAFNQKNGKQLWRRSTTIVEKDGQIGGAIAYAAGRVVVTSSFSECFLLDAKDGKILWRVKLPAPSKGDGITVLNGKAFIICSNSSLQVVNLADGRVLWSHSGMVSDSSYIGDSAVAIDDGVVYAVYPSGEIYALLEETGAVIWDAMMSKFSLTNVAHAFSHLRACPVLKDGVLYVVAANGQTAAFDAKSGKLHWKSSCGGLQTPVVSGDSIFVFNCQSELLCLNRHTGKKRWERKLTSVVEEISDWCGMLLLKDHLLLVTPQGKLMYVSVRDGRIKKTLPLDDSGYGVSMNPVVANGTMYLLLNCGKIVAYR